jgi:hypothetical protein
MASDKGCQMTKASDAAFDKALDAAGVAPDAHDRAAAFRIALFLRDCRARLRAVQDRDADGRE